MKSPVPGLMVLAAGCLGVLPALGGGFNIQPAAPMGPATRLKPTPSRATTLAVRPSSTRAASAGDAGAGTGAASALTGAAMPLVAGKALSARGAAGSASAGSLRSAITAYALDTGQYPMPANGGLAALLNPPLGVKNWNGPYITVTSGRRPFEDPWGNDYRMILTSPKTFMIKSNGPDGLPDTADDLYATGG